MAVVHKQPTNTGRILVMSNRYRCRAYHKGRIDPFYICIVMVDTGQQAIAYVRGLLVSMGTPADRVTAEWLFTPQKEA